MRKFFVSVLVAILCGSFLGHSLFQKLKEEEQEVFREENTVFFLEEGIYDNLERAQNSTKDIATKIIVKEEAKYYVYLAMTTKKENIKRFQDLYKNNTVTIKQKKMDHNDFLTSLEQMDGLVEKTTTKEELETINKVILANYEEMVLKS